MPSQFLLLSPPRTGSTAVRMAFSQMDGVFCHGEVLAEKFPIGFFKMPENGEAMRRGDSVAFYKATQLRRYKLTGIKILHRQFFSDENSGLAQYLIEQEDIPVIHLWRRDLCARYISGINFKLAKRPPIEPVVLQKDEMLQDFRNRLAHRKWVKQFFARHPSVEIHLEDCIRAGDTVWPRVQALLGLPQMAMDLPNKESSQKEKFVNYVANADEMRAYYNGIKSQFEALD